MKRIHTINNQVAKNKVIGYVRLWCQELILGSSATVKHRNQLCIPFNSSNTVIDLLYVSVHNGGDLVVTHLRFFVYIAKLLRNHKLTITPQHQHQR